MSFLYIQYTPVLSEPAELFSEVEIVLARRIWVHETFVMLFCKYASSQTIKDRSLKQFSNGSSLASTCSAVELLFIVEK